MSCSSAICGVLSINSQVLVLIGADEERLPTHCSIIIDLRLGLFMLRFLCVQSNIFVARVLHFSAFISLVLFQFGCFTLSVEAYTKSIYSGPTISYVNQVLFVLNMHSYPAG